MGLQSVQMFMIYTLILGLICVDCLCWGSTKHQSYFRCSENSEIMASSMEYSVPIENGFGALGSSSDGSEVGYAGYESSDEGGFEVVKRKRKRRDTGGARSCGKHFDDASMEIKLTMIFEDLQVLKTGQKNINKGMSTIKSTVATTCKKVDEVINVTNNNVSLLKLLSYKSIDIEARSRRNNLIIRGVSEEHDENCFHTVRHFICDHINLDANGMFLVRVHRLRARRRGLRPFEPQKCPLIVAFRNYTDTVEILEHAKRLKGTSFSVDKDYPREIYEARKRLWPLLKEKRREHPKTDVFIRYPAKLMVDKVVIRDEFPDWFAVLNGKREVTVGNVEPLLKQPQSCSIFPNVPPRPINAVHVSENINERTFHSNNSESRGINIVRQPGQSITETWENVPLNVPQSKSTVGQRMSMSVTQSA